MDLLKTFLANMAIAGSGGEVGVAQEMLNNGDLGLGFHEMGSEAVTKTMDAARSREFGAAKSAIEEVLARAFGHGQLGVEAWEEKRAFGFERPVVGSKHVEKRVGEEGISGFVSFGVRDEELMAIGADVLGFNMSGL